MANQPGVWDRFKDAVVMSAINNPLWGGTFYRGANRLRGYSNQEINADLARRNAAYEAKYKNAPIVQPHTLHGLVTGKPSVGDYFAPSAIGRGAVTLLGNLVGGVDPTFGFGGGETAIARTARQAAIQAAADTGRQAINIHQGTQKKFDPTSPVKAAAMGAVFQGLHEGAAMAKPSANPKVIRDEDLTPVQEAPLAPDGLPGNGSVRPMDPKVIAKIMNDPEAAGLTGINDNTPNRRVNNRDVDWSEIHDDDLQALPPANQEYVKEQQAPQEPPAQEPAPPPSFEDLADEHLTPAEKQDYDASAPKPQVDEAYGEVPYEAPPAAANDQIDPMNEVPEGLRSHKGFEETAVHDDGTKFLNYTATNGQTIPIKMGIEPDGTAEMAIDQFGNGANSLGPREIRSAMNDLMEMYPEIKKFGGFRRSGAGAGRVQEVTPAPRESLGDLLANEEGSFNPWGRNKRPKLEDIPEEELTPEQRVQLGIRAAEPVRNAQEAAMRVERAKRFESAKDTKYVQGGEAGFHQEKSQLAGEYEQLPSPYSIRPKLNQAEVDDLFDKVRDHPALSYTDTIHAREALQKLLANSGAAVPTRSELESLRKVFPEDPKADKKSISSWISDVINAPRSIMASMDLSAPLRQGLPMIHRKEYWTAFGSMFKQIGEKGFEAVKQDIASRPTYHMMRDSGLALTDVDDAAMSHHEERFLSNLATKIPVFGHVVKGSERAYVGFLNKLRADTFDSLVKNARAAGKNPSDAELKAISKYINTATGRGDLNDLVPKFLRGEEFDANKASPILSGTFFSPRLMASRFAMLNPVYYAKLYKQSPQAAYEAAKSLASTVAFTTTALGIAHMAGLKVGYDPRSTDFGKIRVGNTTYDMTGGFSSYVRLIAQGAYGERKNVDGTTTKMPNRIKTIGNFLANKESPPLALVHGILSGMDNNYDKLDRKHLGNVAEDVGKDFVPLVAQDTYSVYKDAGAKKAAASAIPDLFGIGVNTYEQKPKGSRSKGFKTSFGSSGFGHGFKSGF